MYGMNTVLFRENVLHSVRKRESISVRRVQTGFSPSLSFLPPARLLG